MGRKKNQDGEGDANWTDTQTQFLVLQLLDAKRAGNSSERGFKKTLFKKIAEHLEGKHPAAAGTAIKSQSAVIGKWQRLKNAYKEVAKLRDQSGFRWDDVRKVVTAPDDVWDKWCEKHGKTQRKWKTTPYPHYDSMHEICEGSIATGRAVLNGALGKKKSTDATSVHESGTDSEVSSGDEKGGADADSTSEYEIPEKSSKKKSKSQSKKRAASPEVIERKSSKKLKVSPSTTRSSSPASVSTSAAKPAVRQRATASGAIASVGETLSQIAQTYANRQAAANATGTALDPSPVRRKRAIQQLQKEKNLTAKEKASGIQAFVKNTAAADAYTEIEDDDVRSEFIASMILDK